jgi:hypothetical protein
MTEANSYQVDGSHYRADYQHWDWVIELEIPYLMGCFSKYVLRWKDKAGVQDLIKSRHYLQKQMELRVLKNTSTYDFTKGPYYRDFAKSQSACQRLFDNHPGLDSPQKYLLRATVFWNDFESLRIIERKLVEYIHKVSEVRGVPQGAAFASGAATVAASNQRALLDQNSGAAGAARPTNAGPRASSTSREPMENPFGYDGEG